jgi:hypothetical protein
LLGEQVRENLFVRERERDSRNRKEGEGKEKAEKVAIGPKLDLDRIGQVE